ncbi:MAG: M50 family metallopeptidase [Armatimonadota bacterium]|nr:M50 family metallopeptidase [Armatimonadota bacterium]
MAVPEALAGAPNILLAVLAFGAMIFVHEFGHFLMARRFGVRVHAFALGFGPRLIAWRRGETQYAVNMIPFGGYVRMEGEDTAGPPGEGSFRAKRPGARAAIIAAGPAMNLVLAVVILASLAAVVGVATSTRVRALQSGWPAEAVGMRPGDIIVAADGVPMGTEQLIETINAGTGRPLALLIRRDGQDLTVSVTPRLDPERGVGRIGFTPEPIMRRLSPIAALAWGVRRTGQYVVVIFAAVEMLIREGRFLANLGGPLAVGDQLVQAAALGMAAFFNLAAAFSIMIGIFNLLPIPALDGGRLAFLFVEAVRRRPIDPRREGLVHMVGFALLLFLLVVLTIKDARGLLLRWLGG